MVLFWYLSDLEAALSGLSQPIADSNLGGAEKAEPCGGVEKLSFLRVKFSYEREEGCFIQPFTKLVMQLAKDFSPPQQS